MQGYRTVATPEDATFRDSDKCLTGTVKARFEEPAMDEISLIIEVCIAAPPVHNLNITLGIERELDPMAAHRKEDCPLPAGTRARG
jgi:hypothetical protein